MVNRATLNLNVLKAWAEVDPNNWRQVAAQLIDLFLSTVPGQLETFKKCRAEANEQGLRRAAHTMKSSYGNVGAEKAHALLSEIESYPEQRVPDQMIDSMFELLKEADAALRVYRLEIASETTEAA